MRTSAAKAAEIELSETMRDIASTAAKTIAAPSPTCHDMASGTPRPVAADFPPVNRIKIDRLCHRMASSATAMIAQGSQVLISIEGGLAKMTAGNE